MPEGIERRRGGRSLVHLADCRSRRHELVQRASWGRPPGDAAVGVLSWVRAGFYAAWAKGTEELWRRVVLRQCRAKRRIAARIADVMNLAPGDVEQAVTAIDPRSIPGNPRFVASGWSEHMLLRYLLALENCAGARVLDSCCGLGWGSHLVASAPAEVTGVDWDEQSVGFCRRRWGSDRVSFQRANVLELPFADESFDVVLCMDAIEHFSLADGERYVGELRRVCRRGGQLFGSSAFPETRWGATRLCRTNPQHQYVYTREEMWRLLRGSFGRPGWVTRHYFQAIRS